MQTIARTKKNIKENSKIKINSEIASEKKWKSLNSRETKENNKKIFRKCIVRFTSIPLIHVAVLIVLKMHLR